MTKNDHKKTAGLNESHNSSFLKSGVRTFNNMDKIKDRLIKSALIIVIAVMFLIFGLFEPRFASLVNVMNIMRQISFNGILAVGMFIVIIGGGTNLSVGSTAALTCVLTFMLVLKGVPLFVVLLIILIIGGLCGALCGVMVAYGNVPSFILTLGVGISLRGIALLLVGGRQITGIYPQEFANIASGYTLGIPNLFLYLVATLVFGIVLMRYTVFGKSIYAVGGNAEAAHLAGLNVRLIKLTTFVISGALAGLVGFLLSSRITLGDPTVAEGFDLRAVATSVIGGASLSGGVGDVSGAFLGSIIIGTMSNGFAFLGIPPLYQNVMEGMIVVTAVFWDTKSKSLRK